MRGGIAQPGYSRTGQITLFFIIGIVLLFTAMILYFMLRRTAEVEQVDPTRTLLSSYVGTCVDTAVQSKVRELASAGGVWATAQDAQFGTVNSAKVIYGVTTKRKNGDIGPLAYDPPRYPQWGLPLSNTAQNPLFSTPGDEVPVGWTPMYGFQDGYFGDVNLPAICARDGPNAHNSSEPCRYYIGTPMGTHGYKYDTAQLSTEEYLQQQIVAAASDCINASLLQSSLGAQVSLVSTKADVAFTQQAILLSLKYKVMVDGKEQEIGLTPRYGIRYLAIAQFAADLAREETKNASFDIVNDYVDLPSYRRGFLVSRTDTGVPANTTLITITDEQSKIANEQLHFRFLIQHRPPVLAWIKRSDIPAVCSAGPAAAPRSLAIDPDDEPVTCVFDGTTLTVEDASHMKDCQQFDQDGNPKAGAYSC